MLTGKMVRVRYAKGQVIPYYLDTGDAEWLEVAERLLAMFRGHHNSSRGELEADIRETFGNAPNPQIYQGLAKLLEDRSDFSVVSGLPPEQVRAVVFRLATAHRQKSGGTEAIGIAHFDRDVVIREAADELEIAVDELERCLFADLRSEQQMVGFKDLNAERLLQRYNVALAQAVLLRASAVRVKIRGESPRRYRQLLRQIKFHRLMCEFVPVTEGVWQLTLDGPLSLFSSTQKYGLQLAIFLPALLQCDDFELQADLLWGPSRQAKRFQLSSKDGLVSHYVDSGMYVPAELAMFIDLFHKKIDDWEIRDETEILPLGDTFWVPDYQLLHKATGQVVYLEVLGFWRRSSVEQQLERLRKHAPASFVLAVSEQLHVEEAELAGLPAAVYRFRQMPLVKEVVKAAAALIDLS